MARGALSEEDEGVGGLGDVALEDQSGYPLRASWGPAQFPQSPGFLTISIQPRGMAKGRQASLV